MGSIWAAMGFMGLRAMSQVRICRPIIPLSFAPIFMKEAHSAESNEKSIFRFLQFLFFQLWLIVFTFKKKKKLCKSD